VIRRQARSGSNVFRRDTGVAPKHEARSTKHETRNNPETEKKKRPKRLLRGWRIRRFGHFPFGAFEFVSDFELRASDLAQGLRSAILLHD
jgi:hypothetical protein